jgi:hypothetical protein
MTSYQGTTRKLLLIPLLALFAASCSVEVSDPEVTVGSGETMPVTIRGVQHYPPPLFFDVSVKSSDENVVTITRDPAGGGRFTLEGHSPGTAYITPVDQPFHTYITVHVFACVAVTMRPLASPLVVKPGSRVEMRVVTTGVQTLSREWFEERDGQWLLLPFSDSDVYPFTPRTTGTYRFLVRHHDRCGDAGTLLTVVATTRGRAALH